jgi:hypothetical protein
MWLFAQDICRTAIAVTPTAFYRLPAIVILVFLTHFKNKIMGRSIKCNLPGCTFTARRHNRCERHARPDWLEKDLDLLDSDWYKEGCRLIDQYLSENREAKISELCSKFESYQRVMNQIVGTLRD